MRPRELAARTPLRIRLIAGTLVLVVLALTAMSAAGVWVLKGYLVERADGQLRTSIAWATNQIERQLRHGNKIQPRVPSEMYIQVRDPEGTQVYEEAPLGGPGEPRLSADLDAALDRPFTTGNAPERGPAWRVLVEALPSGGRIVLGLSLAEIERTVGRLVLIDVIVGVLVLAGLAGLGVQAVRLSLRPLEDIERTAGAIAAGDLSRRVPAADPRTEVGRLGMSFNAMIAQIEAAFRARAESEATARRSEERMRRFVADASHELRTPLTAIRGFAEFYRQGAAREPAEVDRLIGRIEQAAGRMGLLVEDLLLLARLDRQRPVERRPVDLLAVAADSVQEARVVAPDRAVELTISSGIAYQVLGDEPRLRQVFGNLLSNAVAHTPEGSPVEVRLSSGSLDGAPAAVVEVADRGPGLTPEQAERVFERFYRADQSRSREDGGTGLGLAIVAALVAAHDGRVEVDAEPDGGAVFRVVLPLAD
ncbi:ATP-binding protein [Actinomadura kijaniata]|uniref:sensor histidine kinase n=1 Tax=Actinomadura kijaniata TaxID=46161 RepID=UPI003F1A5A67